MSNSLYEEVTRDLFVNATVRLEFLIYYIGFIFASTVDDLVHAVIVKHEQILIIICLDRGKIDQK